MSKAKQQKVSKVTAPVQTQDIVVVTHQAPLGTKPITVIAQELGLQPKNARRILRAIKATLRDSVDYQHNKGNRHFLNAEQEKAFRDYVTSRRAVVVNS